MRADFRRREGMSIDPFADFKRLLCCRRLNLLFKVRFFKVQILTLLLYGSETWDADAKELLGLLGKTNEKFARLLTPNKVNEENDKTLQKIKLMIGTPASFLRRKLNWLGDLLEDSNGEMGCGRMAAKIANGNRLFFQSYLADVSWEEATKGAKSGKEWEEIIKRVMVKFGIKEEGWEVEKSAREKIREENSGIRGIGGLLESGGSEMEVDSEEEESGEGSAYSMSFRDINSTSESASSSEYTSDSEIVNAIPELSHACVHGSAYAGIT